MGWFNFSCVALAMASVSTVANAAAPRMTVEEQKIGLWSFELAISGSKVLYNDVQADWPTLRVFNLENGQDTPLTDDYYVGGFDINGSDVVSCENYDIRQRNIETGERWSLTADGTESIELYPSISNRLIAWLNYTSKTVVVYDRKDGSRRELPRTKEATRPIVSGSRLIYCDLIPPRANDCDLKLYDAESGELRTLLTQTLGNLGTPYDLDGDAFVIATSQGTVVYDIWGQQLARRPAPRGYFSDLPLSLSGEWVAFQEAANPNDYDLLRPSLWKWTTGDVFTPTNKGTYGSINPVALEGSRFVFSEPRGTRMYDFKFIDSDRVADVFDDFNSCTSSSGLGPAWTTTGQWSCQGQQARSTSTRAMAIAQGPDTWETEVSARIESGMTTSAGVVARWSQAPSKAPSYYAARLVQNRVLELIRVDGAMTAVLASASLPPPVDGAYTVGLKISGQSLVTLEVTLNGNSFLSASESNEARLSAGRAGLMHDAGAPARFDNFRWFGTAANELGEAPTGYADGFDLCASTTNIGPRWLLNGTWFCVGQSAWTSGGVRTALVDLPESQYHEIQATVRGPAGMANFAANATSGQWGAGLILRQKGDSYYAARLSNPTTVQVVRVDGVQEQVLAELSVEPPADGVYHLYANIGTFDPDALTVRVTTNGRWVSTWAYDVGTPIPSGRAGLLATGDGTLMFDNFSYYNFDGFLR